MRYLLSLFCCMLLLLPASAETSEKTMLSEDGLYTYSINGDGSITLRSFEWNTQQRGADLIVPSAVDGYVVSTIGTQCFVQKNNYEIGTLVIPNSIRHIHPQAFYGLVVNHISIPNSVEVIEQGAFVIEFTSISVGKDCPNYTSVKGGLYEKSTKTLIATAHQGIEILDGIRVIGAYACYGIAPKSIELSRIPSSVEEIGHHAFHQAQLMCDASEAYHIPAVTLGDYAFSETLFKRPYSGTVDITFHEELTVLPAGCFAEAAAKWNRYVKYWDSNDFKYKHTYDYFNTTLSVHLPDTLIRIEDSAFERFGMKKNRWSSDEYGSIVLVDGLPAGLKSIGAHSFEIKGTVDIFSPDAFAKCTALTEFGASAFQGAKLKAGNGTYDALHFMLPEALTIIGDNAFCISNDHSYTFALPWNLSNIGKNAFNKHFVTLEVHSGSYSEAWANQHAYRSTTNEDDDLSWLYD